MIDFWWKEDESKYWVCFTYHGEQYDEKSKKIAVGIDDLQSSSGGVGASIFIGDQVYGGSFFRDEGGNHNVTLDKPNLTLLESSNLQVQENPQKSIKNMVEVAVTVMV